MVAQRTIQPPSAALMVAPRLNSIPMAAILVSFPSSKTLSQPQRHRWDGHTGRSEQESHDTAGQISLKLCNPPAEGGLAHSRSGSCEMNSVTYLSVAGMTPAAPFVLSRHISPLSVYG